MHSAIILRQRYERLFTFSNKVIIIERWDPNGHIRIFTERHDPEGSHKGHCKGVPDNADTKFIKTQCVELFICYYNP